MMRVAGLVLAGGRSRRLGRPKQLLMLDGVPLVRHVVGRALAAGLDEIVVVTGAHAEPVRDALAGLPVRWVHNERHAEGMGTSLAAGVGAMGRDIDAVVVLLADQPTVDPGAIRRAVSARRQRRVPLVMARYGTARGHPVLFGRELFPELRALVGDRGGREVVRAHEPALVLVDGGADEPPLDVDTEADWAALQAAWHDGRDGARR